MLDVIFLIAVFYAFFFSLGLLNKKFLCIHDWDHYSYKPQMWMENGKLKGGKVNTQMCRKCGKTRFTGKVIPDNESV